MNKIFLFTQVIFLAVPSCSSLETYPIKTLTGNFQCWNDESGEITIIKQGNYYWSGYLFFGKEKDFYLGFARQHAEGSRFEIGTSLIDVRLLPLGELYVLKSEKEIEYFITLELKPGRDNLFDSKYNGIHKLKPRNLKEEELDFRFFNFRQAENKEFNMQIDDYISKEPLRTLVYESCVGLNHNDHQYKLDFKNNCGFEINDFHKKSFGTYETYFDKVVFNFEQNEHFDVGTNTITFDI